MDENSTPKIIDTDFVSGDSETLDSVMSNFKKARNYIKNNYQKTWDRSFKAYHNTRTHRGYKGKNDAFLPETFSIVETIKSNIAGSKPRFKYLPLREEQKQDTETLNSLVDYYWAQNNMTQKVLGWIGDMSVYGNGIFYTTWEHDMPLVRHIPLSDFFVDPSAYHMNRPGTPGYPRYGGHRYLTSMEELQSKQVVDVETGELKPRYKNLDKVAGDNPGDEMDKDRKEQLTGTTLGKDSIEDQVEVIVYYTANRVIEVANRDTVIYDEKTPYYREAYQITRGVYVGEEKVDYKIHVPEIRGFLPYAIVRNYADNNLFFARGDVEIILETQEQMNDTASQKRDNLEYALNNMWRLEPRYKHLQGQIESGPGNIIPVPRGAIEPLDKQDISASADTEIQRLQQLMRTTSGADAAVQGVQQQFSRTTATEVQTQLGQASMRFTTKVQTLEDEAFAQLGRLFYKMIQIFVDNKEAVRVIGNKGVEWQIYDPEEYWGEYEPQVVLEATEEAEDSELAQSLQAAAQFSIGNPLVNQEAFLRRMYKSLFKKYMTDEDIEELLTTDQPVMGPDGQPVDPALTQGDAIMTPGAESLMMQDEPIGQTGGDSFAKRTQSGQSRGGGANTNANNIRSIRENHPSTKLDASSKPK